MNTRMTKTVTALIAVMLIGVAIVSAYEIDWYTVDGGGGTSTGGVYEISGAIGQQDARSSAMTGNMYELTGGFWVVPVCTLDIPGDFDGDCDVDQADHEMFENCATGPDVHSVLQACEDMDFDGDSDIDQEDFSTFQRCYSGSGVTGDENCANMGA